MFKVKHLRNEVVIFEGYMELEDVLKLNRMDKLIFYLLSKNENFFLIIGLGNEEWNIVYAV